MCNARMSTRQPQALQASEAVSAGAGALYRTDPKAAPLRAGGFEEAGALEEAGPQVLAFPTRLPCQMSSSSVLARVKWEDAESRCVPVALVAGPPQGNRRLRKGALSQTSYQLLGEMVDTWRRGASRREQWETGSKEKLGPRSCGAIRMLGER